MSTYVFDLDGTLCHTESNADGHGMRYYEATPFYDRIEVVNNLWKEGHTIIIETARGCGTKINHYEETFDQLRSWGLKFTSLRTGVKFGADYFIDDKGVYSEDFFSGKFKGFN